MILLRGRRDDTAHWKIRSAARMLMTDRRDSEAHRVKRAIAIAWQRASARPSRPAPADPRPSSVASAALSFRLLHRRSTVLTRRLLLGARPPVAGAGSAPAVDVAAVADRDDTDQPGLVVKLIDHAVRSAPG